MKMSLRVDTLPLIVYADIINWVIDNGISVGYNEYTDPNTDSLVQVMLLEEEDALALKLKIGYA